MPNKKYETKINRVLCFRGSFTPSEALEIVIQGRSSSLLPL